MRGALSPQESCTGEEQQDALHSLHFKLQELPALPPAACLSAENLLVHNETVKIADFGLARETRSRPPYTGERAPRLAALLAAGPAPTSPAPGGRCCMQSSQGTAAFPLPSLSL